MAAAVSTAKVTGIHHWNDRLFSFTIEREPGFRFENGHFVMIGLKVNGKPLLRAYSIASPNYAEELEFFSIKVENGPLTSRLQHIEKGDEVLISMKPVGTLVLRDIRPGRRLYLFATGTGLAPFLSIIRDPFAYEQFEKLVLVHSVRRVCDLAYRDFLTKELPDDDYLGELIREQLLYYPTVTREPCEHSGRITTLVESGKLEQDLGLPKLNPTQDRAMICGSIPFLKDMTALLDSRGLKASPNQGEVGDYVIERAFVG